MAGTLRTLVSRYAERLATAGVESPRLSAEVLLAHAMAISRADFLKKLLLEPNSLLAQAIAGQADSFIGRRAAGEPVAYITGIKEFYGRDFAVTPATLIPRPDTETVVDAALAFVNQCPPGLRKNFLDCGTGSGAIAVTLALELPSWHGMAVDLSPEALTIASRNATALGAANLDCICCDYLGPDLPRGPFGLLVANPPYVSEEEYHDLSFEVRGFEPRSALVPPVAESNGLEHLEAILAMAGYLLVPGGLLLMEMGYTQGGALMKTACAASAWADCRIIPDLAGQPRVFHALRTEA